MAVKMGAETLDNEKKELKEDLILSHNYNPKFELLSAEEVPKLIESLKISSGLEMPKINMTDPVCKLFKAKPNDIFKITRKSYTAGESVFYRVVIDE